MTSSPMVPVVILCGGFGTRLGEEAELKPKPLVEIGGRPVLWHIMKTYAHYGFKDFILCLGYKGDMIRQYFYNYEILSNDFTVDLGSGSTAVHSSGAEVDWKVTLADTGLNAATGARIKRIEKYIDSDIFMLTYGDGVTNLKVDQLIEFHTSHGRIGTVTAVTPPSHYGELEILKGKALSFREKPSVASSQISGGYFVFHRKFFDYLDEKDDCTLEREPLEQLTAESQLMVYSHQGFWQCMDTPRDLSYLRDQWENGKAPWAAWS